MAIKDFRNYLQIIQKQYHDAKEDLRDFEQALKDGYITENQLDDMKEEFFLIERNYKRLLYVDYLLCTPKRKNKKKTFFSSTAKDLDFLSDSGDDADSVIRENTTALNLIKLEIEKLNGK